MSIKEYTKIIINILRKGLYRLILRVAVSISIFIGGLLFIDWIFVTITHRPDDTFTGVAGIVEVIVMILYMIFWLIYGFGYWILVKGNKELEDL